jgi:hypothetical protein
MVKSRHPGVNMFGLHTLDNLNSIKKINPSLKVTACDTFVWVSIYVGDNDAVEVIDFLGEWVESSKALLTQEMVTSHRHRGRCFLFH